MTGGGPKVKGYLLGGVLYGFRVSFLSSCIFLGCEFENFVPRPF